MAGSRFTLDIRELKEKVNDLPEKVERAIFAAIEFQRAPAESHLRSSAKWTDRTSNARNKLHAVTEHSGGSHQLIMAHGVPYGIWLEVRWSGRFAVIEPAVLPMGEQVMRNLENAFGRLT